MLAAGAAIRPTGNGEGAHKHTLADRKPKQRWKYGRPASSTVACTSGGFVSPTAKAMGHPAERRQKSDSIRYRALDSNASERMILSESHRGPEDFGQDEGGT